MRFGTIRIFSLLMMCLAVFSTTQAQETETELMVVGNNASGSASLSADGRYISFLSDADNLVPDDKNATTDIFLHDQQTGLTTRVSVSAEGEEGNDYSTNPQISPDGGFVVFESMADNLVPDDTNNTNDIFVYERETGAIRRVSITSDGTEGDGSSLEPAISGDGQRVVFWTNASNLAGDEPLYGRNVYLHDLATGETRLISAADGTPGNDDTFNTRISADGRVVAFWSKATNLVTDDTNATEDIFVHDVETGEISRVTVASDGSEANGYTFDTFDLSADGRFIVFQSQATNLVDGVTLQRNEIYLHDRQTGETSHISATLDVPQAECRTSCLGSSAPSISADGNIIVFTSDVDGLITDDTNETWDVFLHDRQTGETVRVSVNGAGEQLNGSGTDGVVSADGRFVAFETGEALVTSDVNLTTDIYLYDRETGAITLVSGYRTE